MASLLWKWAGKRGFVKLAEHKSITLGRGAELPLGDRMVSRPHAIIEPELNGSWTLTDSSINGTFINGSQVLKGRKVILHDKDIIRLATYNEAPEITFRVSNEMPDDSSIDDTVEHVLTGTVTNIKPAPEPEPEAPGWFASMFNWLSWQIEYKPKPTLITIAVVVLLLIAAPFLGKAQKFLQNLEQLEQLDKKGGDK
jgi:pSer/pThr/pTyr-binding forkhead associated (FHA) protein